MIPQPDMDVAPPSSAKDDAFNEPGFARYDKNLPEEDRQAAQKNEGDSYLHLSSLDQQETKGVEGFYNLKTGDLAVYDSVTGKTEHGTFKSGPEGVMSRIFPGVLGNPIAKGDYAILQRGSKDGFRLEKYDEHFGNDVVESSGQDELRMHGPGNSTGCVTARDQNEWGSVQSLIRGRQVSEMSVDSKSMKDRLLSPGAQNTERLPFYGTLHVF